MFIGTSLPILTLAHYEMCILTSAHLLASVFYLASTFSFGFVVAVIPFGVRVTEYSNMRGGCVIICIHTGRVL